MRITGALRTDGILRGLGGLYAGAYTTTQRDAIAAGSRPAGLAIFNTTTNRWEVNLGSDATPNWQPIAGVLAHHATHEPGGSDPIDFSKVFLVGTHAARPAASAVPWLRYLETDTGGGTEFISNGSVWLQTSPGVKAGAPRINSGSWPPVSPIDGEEAVMLLTNGLEWKFKYNATSSSPYKWEFAGGSELTASGGPGVGTVTTLTLPADGDFYVQIGVRAGGTGGNQLQAIMQKDGGTFLNLGTHGNDDATTGNNAVWKELITGVTTSVGISTGTSNGRTNIFVLPLRIQ